LSAGPLRAQIDSVLLPQKSLIQETMLHPGDASTGYVFRKGEWSYNQAITPYPSWAWWGITDWLTAELDIEAWLGAVPSFNFRFGLLKQENLRPTIAYETMFQYLEDERDQFQNLDYLQILRQGASWYHHLNMSWKLRNKWHLHLSGGATFSNSLSISNGDTINFVGKSFSKLLSPDLSLGLDWRMKRWITLISNISYGSTFLYADNIPRKQQITLASRVAPFINSKKGFLNSFRFELTLLFVNFDDAKENFFGPIGFLYWQWDWSKDRIRRKKTHEKQEK
jgi:hypothetical protein